MAVTAMSSSGSMVTETVFYCVFSVLVIATNLHLIFIILSKSELRRNSKYILVLALAFIDLFVGVFTLPVIANMLITTSNPSCNVRFVLQASPYFYIMMGCLAIAAINLDYNFRISMTNYIDRIRQVMTGVLLALFIVVPFAILVPIFFNGQPPDLPAFGCIIVITKTLQRAALVVTYWVPVVCILLTATIVVIKYRKSKRPFYGNQQFPTNYQYTSNHTGGRQYQQTTDSQNPGNHIYQLPSNSQQFVAAPQYTGSPPQQAPATVLDANNPSDLIVAALVTIAMLLPEQVIYIVISNCQTPDCFNMFVVSLKLVQFLGYSKSFLLPLVWHINKGFRDARRGVQGAFVSQNNAPTELPPSYYFQQQDIDAPPFGQSSAEPQKTKY